MISFSTPLIDPSGELVLNELPASDVRTLMRRVQSTQTLDGGRDIEDLGFQLADRPIEIQVHSTAAVYDQVKYLIQNYPLVGFSSRLGFHQAAIKQVRDMDGKITISCELAA